MAATVQARGVSAEWVCGNDRVNKNCSPRARAGHSQNQIVRLDRGSTSVDDDHPELRSHAEESVMSPTRPAYHAWCGIDVAAKSFTATWTTDRASFAPPLTAPQTPDGIATLQQALTALGLPPTDILIVLEATGSYWISLAVALHTAGFAVSIVNPKQVYHWAQSLPRRGKTDALDARMLTQYAWERQPRCWTPPPAVYHELRQRLSARDGLVSLRQNARNQLHALRQWPVQVTAALQPLEQIISDLDSQIAELETAIAQVLRDGAWAASAELMQSIIGIGPLTTAWVLVLTVNFERCPTAEAAANYAGLIPLPRESGTSVRGRGQLGHDGNVRLRTALYRATVTAARFNPIIKAFYERLLTAGKPRKVARCAAARKLLLLIYAVVNKQRPFDPAYGQAAVSG
jgi:transposase